MTYSTYRGYQKNKEHIDEAANAFSVKAEQLSASGMDLKDVAYGLVKALKAIIEAGPESHLVTQELQSFSHELFNPVLYVHSEELELFFDTKPIDDIEDPEVINLLLRKRTNDGHGYYEVGPFENVLNRLGVSLKKTSSL